MCIHWFSKIDNGGYGFRARAKKEARPGMTAVSVPAAQMRPSLCHNVPLSKSEGAGNAGCALHRRSHAQWREWMRARAYGLSGGIRHPLRNGLTAYAVLSPATNSSCHRRRRILATVQTRSGLNGHRRLGTSNGCQDHTVLPYATTSFVLRGCNRSRGSTRPATAMARRRSRVHHIPSRVRDDARPPLLSERDGRR